MQGEERTCCRCGATFPAPGRICAPCREEAAGKPRSINRQLAFREKQVIGLVAAGKLNKEIGFELHLTEGTIKEYLNRIFRKVRVTNRTELAVWWLTEGVTL